MAAPPIATPQAAANAAPPSPASCPSPPIDSAANRQPAAKASGPGQRLRAAARSGATSYYRQCVAIAAEHLGASVVALDLRIAGRIEQHVHRSDQAGIESVVSMAEGMLIEAQSEHRGVVRAFDSSAGQELVASSPLVDCDGAERGAVAAVVGARQAARPAQLASQLQALADLMMACRPGQQAPPSQGVQRALERASGFQSAQELAFSLVNSLSSRGLCQQASLGIVRGQRVKILAVSGMSRVPANGPATQRMEQAMDECLDRGEPILSQSGAVGGEGSPLHERLRRAVDGAVYSTPLLVNGEVVAVATFVRAAGEVFSDADQERLKSMASPFGAPLRLLQRRQAPLAAKATGLLSFARKGRGGRIAVAAAVALCLWGCFGSSPSRIRVSGVVTAMHEVQISAPFDGVIAEALARPGDRVVAGQLLARMDTRELKLDRSRLQSELGVADLELQRALTERQSGQAALAAARRRAVLAQLQLLEQRIDSADLRATRDGLLLSGELQRRVGQRVPQGEPLLQIGEPQRIVELLVPAERAGDVRPGSALRFAASAEPGRRVTGSVLRVLAAAELQKGRSMVRAEAALDDAPSWMAPGMDGAATVDAGRQRIWWLAARPFCRWLQRWWGP